MKKSLTGNQLKAIAAFCMLIDHVGAFWIGPALKTHLRGEGWILCYLFTRLTGRLAFPFYCFLAAEGAHHTRDRMAYAKRLILFAIISEIPFNLAVYGKAVCMDGQNVFFTLGLSVLMLVPESPWMRFILLPVACILSTAVGSDYGLIGPVVIYGMVLGRTGWGKYLAAFCIISYGVCALMPGMTGVMLTCLYAGIWAFIVHLYHGRRGREGLQRFFYWFYPVHLMVLWIVQTLCR